MKRRVIVVGFLSLMITFSFSAMEVQAAVIGNGDVNGSGVIDISDATYLLNWLFLGGTEPVACSEFAEEDDEVVNGDVNGSGAVDISDATYVLNWLFLGGIEPVPCSEPAAPHDVHPFSEHSDLAVENFDETCSGCHGMDSPSPLLAAPACTTCHTGGSPFLGTDCSSCHANPPNGALPVGEIFPNRPGAHAKHLALSSINGECDICHSGGGTMSGLAHLYDGIVNQATKDATFDANSGAIIFQSNRTCRNVSCHGGIQTPDWQSGSISVTTNAGCEKCHRAGSEFGDPEANSQFSGRHRRHLNEGINCTTCHDMSGDENHFRFLDTPEIEGPVRYSNTSVTFSTSTRRCSGVCHGESHSSDRW